MGSVCIVVIVSATVSAGVLTLQQRGTRLRMPWATFALAAVVLAVSVAGELSADLLGTLGRDLARLQAGEWWRTVSPLVVQDGRWPGLIFNVVALVAIGALVETLFPRWVVPIAFIVTGLVGELAAYTIMPGQGFAGNSVANLGLAVLVLVAGLRSPRVPARIAGAVGMLAGAILLVTWDLHAVGVTVGALLALVLWWVSRGTADGAASAAPPS